MKALSHILKGISFVFLFFTFFFLLQNDTLKASCFFGIYIVLKESYDTYLCYTGKKTTVDSFFKKYVKEEDIIEFNKEYAIGFFVISLLIFTYSILGFVYIFSSIELIKKIVLIISIISLIALTVFSIKLIKKYKNR